MKKIRLAIIGIGGMGKKYAQIVDQGLIEGLELTCVCSRSEAAKIWVIENLHQGIVIYKNADQLFEHIDMFDALLIVTPHKIHPELAIRAFAHDKHVLCDKPAGISLLDVAKMNKAGQDSGKVFSMIFHQRFYAKYQYIKKMLETGELGSLKRILLENSRFYRTSCYHQSGAWRSSWNGEGGGLLINQGQHILDIWQWLLGMPTALYAMIPFGKYNDFQVDDEATLLMEYPNKQTATLILSTGEGSYTERLEIIGTKGKLLLTDDDLHIWKFSQDIEEYGKSATVFSRENLTEEYCQLSFKENQNLYQMLLQNFANAILIGEPLMVSGKEGLKSLELMAAAYLSAWRSEKIAFPIDADLYERELLQKMKEENRIKESTIMNMINQFAKKHQPEQLTVSDFAGSIYLSGARSFVKAAGDSELAEFIKHTVAVICQEDGTLIGRNDNEDRQLVPMAFGKSLSYGYELTGEEKYLKAMTALGVQLKKQPRTKNGIFTTDSANGVSFQELYQTLPFYTEFETKYHRKEQYNDIIAQIKSAREEYLKLPEKGKWAEKAWYMMALMDAFSEMSEESFEHYKTFSQFFKEAWAGLKKEIEKFHEKANDDIKLMVAYTVLKGCRLEVLLAEKHFLFGKVLFASISQEDIQSTMTAGLYLKALSEVMMAETE